MNGQLVVALVCGLFGVAASVARVGRRRFRVPVTVEVSSSLFRRLRERRLTR